MTMRVLGISGPYRAGKSTAANHLHCRHGALLLSNSKLLIQILSVLEISPSRNTMRLLGESLFASFGKDVIARACINKIRQSEYKLVVVDGIRFPDEVKLYRSTYKNNFKLLFIDASSQTRYLRSLSANEPEKFDEKGYSISDFEALSCAVAESFINELKSMADCVVTNEEALQNLTCNIDCFVENNS